MASEPYSDIRMSHPETYHNLMKRMRRREALLQREFHRPASASTWSGTTDSYSAASDALPCVSPCPHHHHHHHHHHIRSQDRSRHYSNSNDIQTCSSHIHGQRTRPGTCHSGAHVHGGSLRSGNPRRSDSNVSGMSGHSSNIYSRENFNKLRAELKEERHQRKRLQKEIAQLRSPLAS
eukprot:Rmarinus@m.29347